MEGEERTAVIPFFADVGYAADEEGGFLCHCYRCLGISMEVEVIEVYKRKFFWGG